ncbi:MAG: gamma-glutamylcyclotransferase family protein [Legionella sp.]|nr:gamma-glutamylcyclotransferase family protein [Legionella sp.]
MNKLVLVFLLFSKPFFTLAFAVNCHPQINPLLPQYIVGYGSLIDEQSKKRTDASAEDNIPALIKGYQRSWSAHGNLPGVNATYLSVFEDSSAMFNGVIYRLSNPKQIQQYDKREVIYCRKELSADRLKLSTTAVPDQKQVWIYISTQEPQAPSADYPIVQSYLDVFIRGCIQIEEKFSLKHFAKDCINSTEQWSEYWINDRIFPRRPFLYEPYASRIDALLKEAVPEQFKTIKIE